MTTAIQACHGITATDGLVLHEQPGWHGLGTVVADAPSPKEALTLAHLDWNVELWPMHAHSPHRGQMSKPVTDRRAVVRTDISEVLGVVGDKYEPLQNAQLADFCHALSREGNAKIETAGSIHGGIKVWFLLDAGSLDIRGAADRVRKYLLCSTSHNGSSKVRIAFTSIRVVCRNTLQMALEGSMRDAAIELMHSGDAAKKLELAHETLTSFDEVTKFNVERMRHLAETAATVDDLRDFWAAAYQRDYGKIPVKPVTTVEMRQWEKAMAAWNGVQERWTRETPVAGATWWNVLNSYTGYIQHEIKVRGKNAEARHEKQVDQRLFGVVGARTSQAYRDALNLAV